MTPIPADVAALIVAAGHSLSATTDGSWAWDRGLPRQSPAWLVFVGGECGRGTVRAATLAAIEKLAVWSDRREAEARAEAKRVRLDYRKARALEGAAACAKRAADVRSLAVQVAAMWPEVTP